MVGTSVFKDVGENVVDEPAGDEVGEADDCIAKVGVSVRARKDGV